MRKIFVNVLASFVLLTGASVAQAQCLLCGIVGFALGSSASSAAGNAGGGGAVLYIAPRIPERITDPLGVRLVASRQMGFSDQYWKNPMGGATIQNIFDKTVAGSNQYVVLEVVRVIAPEQNEVAVFWFAYIEKGKVLPLEKLPSPK